MHFDLLQSVSLAGDAATPNDDRVGCGDTLAWVIDGATDLGEPGLVGSRGGAAWLAMEADMAFAAAGDEPVRAICKEVFDRLAHRFDAQRRRDPVAAWELPVASFLVARVSGGSIDCGWLGDCTALLRRADRIDRIGHGAAAKEKEAAKAKSFVGQGLGDKQRPQPIVDALRASRMAPGRHLLGVDPAAVDHVGRAIIPCAAGDELLLMTDGFASLIDDYAAMDAQAMFDALASDGLAGLGRQLRTIEEADAACTRYPRFKRSDDATAIWLRVA